MPASEPIQGLPYQTGGDPPDGAALGKVIVDAVVNRLVMRFSSVADRDSKLTNPPDGSVCWVDATATLYARVYGVWAAVITSLSSSSNLPNIDANKITGGLLATNLIPYLDASKIQTGVLSTSQIPNLDATKIMTGIVPIARGGTGASTAKGARLNLDVQDILRGQITNVTIPPAGITAEITQPFGIHSNFASPPAVFIQLVSSSAQRVTTSVASVSTTGFTLRAESQMQNQLTGQSFYWMAVGRLA